MTQPDSSPQASSGGLRSLIENQPKIAAAFGAAIIVIATLLAYVPAMRGGFVWDDDFHITDNHLLTSWLGLQRIWFDVMPHPAEYPLPQYYPLTHTTFWIEYHLWGLNPLGYHIDNVLLHICDALLVWLLLKKLKVPGSWLAAAIFALHPINVESVAWISERKNVLSLLFYLSSLYVYLRYAKVISGENDNGKERLFSLPDDPVRLYTLLVILFLLALFSKTVTSSMPLIGLVLVWWKRGKISLKNDVLPLLPLIVVGVLMGMLTAHMEQVRVGVNLRPQEWRYASSAAGQFAAECIIAGHAIWFYVGKLIFPYPLIFNYLRWPIDPADLVQYFYPAGVIAVLLALALSRKRLGNGPIVAAVCFIIALFPALGFVPVLPMRYSFVADHFVYLPSIALIALAAAVASRWLSLEGVAGLAAVIMLIFLGLSFQRSQVFYDLDTLWKTTLEQTDQKSWMAANNYGVLLLQRGNLDAAEAWFKKTIQLNPPHPEARFNLARVELLRAEQAAKNPSSTSTSQPIDHRQLAMDYLLDAIKQQPNFIPAHEGLGHLLVQDGKTDQAIDQYKQILAIDPRYWPAEDALGKIAQKQGNLQEAIQHFLRVAEIDPDQAEAHAKLGTALLNYGRLAEGLTEWDEAMRLAPDDAELPNRFGAFMANSHEYAKAIDFFHKALQIDPKSLDAMTNLGVVAAKTGFPAQAAQLFEHALGINPNYAPAMENLADLKSGKLRPATRPATTAAK